MTGMHWAFIPVVFGALATAEGESLMLPAMLISNLAQGSACLAVAVKSRNGGLKQIAASSGVSAIFAGVTEPGLYGVTMPLKRPLAAVCISSGITGLIAGIMNISASSFASPSLLALPIFVHAEKSNNIIMAAVCAAISLILTFVMTWIMGFKDPVTEVEGESASVPASTGEKAVQTAKTQMIGAPVAGKTVSLDQVKDDTFATGVLGNGIAIEPSEGKVYAPFDGKVETVPDSHHALGLCSDSGVELLIHVGLETVRLEGKHFTVHVKEGQSIRKGNLLLEFDLNAIADEGFDTITPVIVTNSDDYTAIIPSVGKQVKAQEVIIETA